jgi:hypothetical protein
MKYRAAALAVACIAAAAGAAPPPNPAAVELRQVLQQYHPASASPPRELSAKERAELRRQIGEHAPPARRRTPQRQGKQ